MPLKSNKFVIKEFLNILGEQEIWRVDWVNIVPKSSTFPQFRLEVFLSPLRQHFQRPINSQKSVFGSQQQRVIVGVGVMPILYMGALFKGGELLEAPTPHPKTDFIDAQVAPSTSQYVNLDAKILSASNDTSPRSVFFPSNFSIGRLAWPSSKESQLLAFCDVEGTDHFQLIIPCVEVLRFFYCTSSLLSSELFSSAWSNLIWQKGCSVENLPESITVGLKTVRGLRRRDAKFLAFSLTDEGATALREVEMSLSSLERGPDFRCKFPFQERTRIRAEVVAIPDDASSRKRYFVTRILKCERPIPFRTCIARPMLDQSQGDNWDDPDLLPVSFGQNNDPKSERRSGPGHSQQTSNAKEVIAGGLTSDDMGPPGNFSDSLELVIEDDRFAGLNDVVDKKFVKNSQKYRNDGSQQSGKHTKVHQSSTTTPELTDNPVLPAQILNEEEAVCDPVLKLFLDCVEPLRRLGYQVTLMPLQKLTPISSRRRSWSAILESNTDRDGHPTSRRRRLACMSIHLGSSHLIVGDIERRDTTTTESFALAGFLLPPQSNHQLLVERLAGMVVNLSGWPSSTSVVQANNTWLAMKKTQHNKEDSAEDLAKRIERSLILPLVQAGPVSEG